MNSLDPHEAIRPVNINVTKSQLENSSNISVKAIKLYELIDNSIGNKSFEIIIPVPVIKLLNITCPPKNFFLGILL